MTTAAVVIGVDNTGLLPLSGAGGGARNFANWCDQQNMDSVTVVTDEKNQVTVGEIQSAIEMVLEPRNCTN